MSTSGDYANKLSAGGFNRAALTLKTVESDLGEVAVAWILVVNQTKSTLHTVASADVADLDEAANALATSHRQLSELRRIVESSSATVSDSLVGVQSLGTNSRRLGQIIEPLQEVIGLFDRIISLDHSADHAVGKATESLDIRRYQGFTDVNASVTSTPENKVDKSHLTEENYLVNLDDAVIAEAKLAR